MKIAIHGALVLVGVFAVVRGADGAVFRREARKVVPVPPQTAIRSVCGDGVCDVTESIETCKEDCQPRPRFSVEAVRPDILPRIAEIGDGLSAAHGLGMLNWGAVEPAPPVGGKHTYRSLRPQDAWWTQAQSILKKTGRKLNCTLMVDRADWALVRNKNILVTDSVTGRRVPGIVGIKKEHIGDWKAFVKHFLASTPLVTFIQIDSEPENTWVDANGYVETLRAAYEAVQEFNREHPGRNVKVLAAGFYLGSLTAIPDDALQRVLAQYPNVDAAKIVREYPQLTPEKVDFLAQKLFIVEGTLRMGGDAFDILTLHHDGGKTYDTIGGVVEWYRRQMQSFGYQKPIWIDDFSTNYHPSYGKQPPADMQKLLQGLTRGNSKAMQVYAEMQSMWMVRKAVGHFAAGIERLSIAYGNDIPEYFMPTWRYMGLFTADGQVKPAFYTAKLMVQKLDYFVRAQAVGNHVYRFTFADRPDVFVAWSESGKTSLDLAKYMPKGQARLTFIINRLGKNGQPIVREAEVIAAGAIPLTEEPVFIEGL
jgi:hypothetical protein